MRVYFHELQKLLDIVLTSSGEIRSALARWKM
ncbi:hypothetical protein LSPH24S_05766 [Lysinibacillus sphaericus]